MAKQSAFSTRLHAALYAASLSQTQLAERLAITKQQISDIKSGKTPGKKYHQAMADVLGVDRLWLITGTGKSPAWWTEPNPIAPLVPAYIPPLEDSEPTPSLTRHDHPATALGRATVTFSGSVSAGEGWTQVEDQRHVSELRPGLNVVRIEGDSAYPVVFPGQYVLVEVAAEPKNGNLVVCQTEDGQALLKRYLIDPNAPGGFILVSVNIGQSVHTFRPDQRPRLWPVVGVLFPRAFKSEPR